MGELREMEHYKKGSCIILFYYIYIFILQASLAFNLVLDAF